MTFDEAFARSAECLWDENIKDTDQEAVSQLFRENNFQWHLNELGDENDLYNGAPGLEYCGHTAAVAGLRMGDYAFGDQCADVRLDPDLASMVFPSTRRLGSSRRWEKAGFRREEASHNVDQLKRGALCTTGDSVYGSHIVICIGEPDGRGEFPTIEGNTTGLFPDGHRGKGVVRRTRNLAEVDCVYLFGPEHTQGSYVLEV